MFFIGKRRKKLKYKIISCLGVLALLMCATDLVLDKGGWGCLELDGSDIIERSVIRKSIRRLKADEIVRLIRRRYRQKRILLWVIRLAIIAASLMWLFMGGGDMTLALAWQWFWILGADLWPVQKHLHSPKRPGRVFESEELVVEETPEYFKIQYLTPQVVEISKKDYGWLRSELARMC
ncbi:MAG: hypothetical protein QME81_13935, partial [bacterium]|nr:hypothetical protein [bacterium]